jgi:hypothetical protein
MTLNKLYYVLLFHLLVIDESVLVARGEIWERILSCISLGVDHCAEFEKRRVLSQHILLALLLYITGEKTSSLRSRQSLSHPDLQKLHPHQQPPSLSTKFRGLIGNTQLLHFEQELAATTRASFHDFMSEIIRFRLCDRGKGGRTVKEQSQPPFGEDDTELVFSDEDQFPRRRLTMILKATTPSSIAQQGLMISASIQQLHIAYKTIGNTIRRSGRRAQRGIAETVKTVGGFLRNAVTFIKRNCRKTIAWLIISLMNALYFFHGQLHALAHEKDLLSDAPAATALSTNCPSPSPLLSRISSASTTTCEAPLTTPASSSPTWLSSSSFQSTAPVVAQSFPAKKKAQVVSVQQLSSNSRTSSDKNLQVVVGVPEPSLLGGLFNKLLGGLLILSTGAMVGYIWLTDWRDVRLHSNSQEFMDVADTDTMGGIHADLAIPITPEASRY